MRWRPRGGHRSVDRGERRPAIEPRNKAVWDADAVKRSGRPHRRGRYPRAFGGSHAVEDPEHAQKLSVQELGYLVSARRARDVDGAAGGLGKANGRTPNAHADEKSDACVVPMNDPNKGAASKPAPAEGPEGRRAAKSNAEQPPAPRTQSRTRASTGLDGVREAARANKAAGKEVRFTALMHHITPQLLIDSFMHLKKSAAAGVDGVRWRDYEEGLVEKIGRLWDAVQSGRYRALPSRRVYIPKADGKQRPLGIAALEDKIVQQAVVTVLTPIYEADFLGFSYGFRPGRNQHQALDALWVGLQRRRVNWVLDADIKAFFDTVDHDWMMRFL
jgi:RNA-directed DNA polymerase